MITEDSLKQVFDNVITQARDELQSCSQYDLERFWFFKYDPNARIEWNFYQFNSMLDLYARKCRQWEELHNGSQCVVERVRDTYIMPKISEFVSTVKAVSPGHTRLPTCREEAEWMVLIGEQYLKNLPE